MTNRRAMNYAALEFILLPLLFLTIALAGGLRVSAEAAHAFVFIAPPLITLLLAALLMMLFARGRLINLRAWIDGEQSVLFNASHALTLLSLFFASAQAFNSVLPERGLLHALFAFFFLWTLWNNQFSQFDARRLLRSLAVLFGTAFVLKHILLANLYASDGGWLKRIAGALLEGASLGTLDVQIFAPATGYISFFTVALYVAGLIALSIVPEETRANEKTENARRLVQAYRELSDDERRIVHDAINGQPSSNNLLREATANKNADVRKASLE
ncbi:MAG: hypothetical protein ABR577_12020 [Pyrinomonadaceae bacterium]